MMKKLMFLFCMLASFIACSDDKNDDPAKPEMPITDLQLPSVNPVAGDNVTIAGKGFAQDCKLQLKPEGAAGGVDVTIVEITGAGITFKVPAEVAGKCTVILLQGGKSYELGELTIDEIPVAEPALYGVFQEGATTSVCPIDVANQKKGEALFTLSDLTDGYEGIVADNHGVVYYKAIAWVFTPSLKLGFELRYYDIKTKKGGTINWAEADKCFSIGTDGERLLALTYDLDTHLISCYAVGIDGNAEKIFTADKNELSPNYTRLYTTCGTFTMYEKDGHNLLYFGVKVDMGESIYTGAMGFYDDGRSMSVYEFTNGNEQYHFVKADKSTYVFKWSGDDNRKTTIHEVSGDMESWRDDESTSPKVYECEEFYKGQVYDPATGLIYGLYGEEDEGILAFNPKTKEILDPWMGSGCIDLLYIKAWE